MLLVQRPVNGHRALIQLADLPQDGDNAHGGKTGGPGRNGFTHTSHNPEVPISCPINAQLLEDSLAG